MSHQIDMSVQKPEDQKQRMTSYNNALNILFAD